MRLFKKFSVVLMSAILILCSCSSVLANNITSPKVYLNGSEIEFINKPILKNNSVCVPLRQITDTIGAEAEYSSADDSTSVIYQNKNIVFSSNNSQILVTENGNTQTMSFAVSPFVQNNIMYVPVRDLANVLGLNIGYDNTANAVILIDKHLFLASHGGSFDIYNKAIKFSQDISKGKQKISGSIKFNMSDNYSESKQILSGVIDINGKSDEFQNAELNCVLSFDENTLDEFINDIFIGELEPENTSDIEKIKEMFKNIDINFIFDGNNYILYLNSNFINNYINSPNSWIGIDLKDMYQDANILDLIHKNDVVSLDEQLLLCIDLTPLDDLEMSTYMLDIYGSIADTLSDEAFKSSSNGYTSNKSIDLGYGDHINFNININTDSQQNVTGIGFNMSLSENGTPLISMDIDSNAKDTKIKANVNIENEFLFDCEGTINQEPTNESVKTKPDGKVIFY